MRPVPTDVIMDGSTFHFGLMDTMPDAGAGLFTPSVLDDDFDASELFVDSFGGSTLDPVWSTYSPVSGSTYTVTGGDLIIRPGSASSGATALGPLVHTPVTSDFDIRIVADPRDVGGAPLTILATSARHIGINVASTPSGNNWLRLQTGHNTTSYLLWWQHAENGTIVAGSAVITDPRQDLRVVRRGHLFYLFSRTHNPSVGIASDAGWTFRARIDRTAVPISSTPAVGIGLRTSGSPFDFEARCLIAATNSFIIDDKWVRYSPVTSAVSTVLAGELRMTPGDTASGFAGHPNQTPGPRLYQFVDGDFDARARILIRNAEDTGPPSNSAAFAAALHCSATESGVADWIEVGARNVVSALHFWRSSALSDGAISGQASLVTAGIEDADFRMVRTDQLVQTFYRIHNPAVPLWSDDGWIFNGNFNRSLHPLPQQTRLGITLRTSSAAAASTSLAKIPEFIVFPRASLGSQVGSRVPVSRWRTYGAEVRNGERISVQAASDFTAAGWALWSQASAGMLIASGRIDRRLELQSGDVAHIYHDGLVIDGLDNRSVASIRAIDMQALFRSRLWTVLRKQPNMQAVSDWIGEQMQQVDNAAADVNRWGRITKAFGKTLDRIGYELGQLRLGLSDDRYREALILRQSSLFRRRDVELIRNLAAILAVGVGATWEYGEEGIATYVLRFYNLPAAIAQHWNTILRYVKPEGVRFLFQTNVSPQGTGTFRFDTVDAGFDQGNTFSYTLEV